MKIKIGVLISFIILFFINKLFSQQDAYTYYVNQTKDFIIKDKTDCYILKNMPNILTLICDKKVNNYYFENNSLTCTGYTEDIDASDVDKIKFWMLEDGYWIARDEEKSLCNEYFVVSFVKLDDKENIITKSVIVKPKK